MRVSSINRMCGQLIGLVALTGAMLAPLGAARAQSLTNIESSFDQTFGSVPRTPQTARQTTSQTAPPTSGNWFDQRLAQMASQDQGRIGVAAVDLRNGRTVGVMGDQPFPLASTSKIAIAATFLELVDAKRASLTDQYPLMVPMPSRKFSSAAAPVRPGAYVSARNLIEMSLIRSDNPATDALLAAVGGPQAVNDWMRRAGLSGMRIDRDIATLVRDDGQFNPATTIDPRDSATPIGMVRLLTGLFQGRWLSPSSRDFLLSTMERCATGKRRIPGLMPAGVLIAHKTGTLSNTSSDVGIIQAPDGRAIAVAIYVTGQGGKAGREIRIAEIARALYDGFQYEAANLRTTAARR